MLGRSVAVLICCGDESADEAKERVFAVAGVIGGEEQWAQLEPKWVERCGGIPFHAKDCDSDQGDYAGKDHKENKALYRDLTIMLAEGGMGGMGIALDLAGQKKVFPDTPGGLPYYKCFIELVQKMKNCAAYNQQQVKFTFDMRPEGEHNTGVLYSLAKRAKEWNPHLDSEISFACSRENPRVQVADLWARETMKGLDNTTGPVRRDPRKSLVCLSDTGRFHIDVFAEEWFRGLKENLPQLEKITRMSMREYAEFLHNRRLVDNMSNRFAYIQYAMDRDGE